MPFFEKGNLFVQVSKAICLNCVSSDKKTAMPSTFTLRFLSISSAASGLLIGGSLIASYGDFDWSSNKLYVAQTAVSTVSYLLLAVFLELVAQQQKTQAKLFALLTIIVLAISILGQMHQIGTNLFDEWNASGNYTFIQLIFLLSNLFLPVGLLLMSISYYSKETFWGYSGRIFAIFHAVNSLAGRLSLLLIYFISQLLGREYFTEMTFVNGLFYLVDPAFDIALLAFIFSSVKVPKPDGVDLEINDELLDSDTKLATKPVTQTEIGLLNWLGKHLLLSIPIVNFVLLVVWSGKSQSRLIRNWAIAQYWISCIGIIISAFIFKNAATGLFSIGIVLFLPILLIAGGIAITSKNDRKPDESDDVTGIGTWLGRIFLAGIPLIGWIYTIILATDNSDLTQQNWAKSRLLLIVVGLILIAHYLNISHRIESLLSYTYFAF